MAKNNLVFQNRSKRLQSHLPKVEGESLTGYTICINIHTMANIIIQISAVLASAVPFVSIAAVCVAAVLLVAYVFSGISHPVLMRALGWCFGIVVGLQIFSIAMLYIGQYAVWSQSPVSQYFLPPHQSIAYFMRYSWFHFARGPAVTFGVGMLFFILFHIGYKISAGRFFYQDEEYTGALAILANPWPQNILVIGCVLVLGLAIACVRVGVSCIRRAYVPQTLFSLRMLWPLVGLFMVFFGNRVTAMLGLDILNL